MSNPETREPEGPLLWDVALRALPVGAIVPSGWLHSQLRLHTDGLTGQLEQIWLDVGPRSGWLGGDGEDWERGPYYCDGLIPLSTLAKLPITSRAASAEKLSITLLQELLLGCLAYLLGDGHLIAKARQWVEWTLGSQRPDGQFGPIRNDDWWPRMVVLKALIQYHEATGDIRALPFMTRYFRYQVVALPERPPAD